MWLVAIRRHHPDGLSALPPGQPCVVLLCCLPFCPPPPLEELDFGGTPVWFGWHPVSAAVFISAFLSADGRVGVPEPQGAGRLRKRSIVLGEWSSKQL